MKLTVQRVMDVLPLITKIISENRPMPQRGKYRLARMHAEMLPEFQTANDQRNALIKAYETVAPESETQPEIRWIVPADKLDEFNAAWAKIAGEEIELDIRPIPLAYIDLGNGLDGSITAHEIVILGDLVAE